MTLRSRARTVSSPQPVLGGAMTLTVQAQILSCCFIGSGEEVVYGGEIDHATAESTISKIIVPPYFWQRRRNKLFPIVGIGHLLPPRSIPLN